MDLSRALGQLADIHQQIAKGEIYRGYRSVPVAASGFIGFAAAWTQPPGSRRQRSGGVRSVLDGSRGVRRAGRRQRDHLQLRRPRRSRRAPADAESWDSFSRACLPARLLPQASCISAPRSSRCCRACGQSVSASAFLRRGRIFRAPAAGWRCCITPPGRAAVDRARAGTAPALVGRRHVRRGTVDGRSGVVLESRAGAAIMTTSRGEGDDWEEEVR